MRMGKRKSKSVWMLCIMIFIVTLLGMSGCSREEDGGASVSGNVTDTSSAESDSDAETPDGENPQSGSDHQTPTPTQEVSKEDQPQEAEPVAIENYLLDGEWMKLKDLLDMERQDLGDVWETGEVYEIDGFSLLWSTYMMDDAGIFTMENTGSTAVSIYGACVGDGIGKVDSTLKENGWTALDDGHQYIVIYNGSNLALDFRLDENQVITGWYLCNWPEGDFSENFVGLENQQVNAVPAQVNVYEGEYMYDGARSDAPVNKYYTVMVEDVTEDSFDFTIYYVDALAGKQDVVFRTHTAIFEGDGTYARYHGEQYQLEFTFPDCRGAYPDAVDMQITGYEPVEGMNFSNSEIPGHEFG